MATGLENAKCYRCGKPATGAFCATVEVPARDLDVMHRRYEPDPEGPVFWCAAHELGVRRICQTCHHWRDRRCTNATILDFVKNDPNAITETPPEFSCHLHERRKIDVTDLSDVDENGELKRRFEEVG